MKREDALRIEQDGPASFSEAEWVRFMFASACQNCLLVTTREELRRWQAEVNKWSRLLEVCQMYTKNREFDAFVVANWLCSECGGVALAARETAA